MPQMQNQNLDERLEQAFLDLQEIHLHFTMRSVIKPPREEDRAELVQLQGQAAEYQHILMQIETLWKIAKDE